jgi:hypothetical protein
MKMTQNSLGCYPSMSLQQADPAPNQKLVSGRSQDGNTRVGAVQCR